MTSAQKLKQQKLMEADASDSFSSEDESSREKPRRIPKATFWAPTERQSAEGGWLPRGEKN
jgi:hypothetical protein